LSRLFNGVGGAHQYDDDVSAQDHSQQLRLQHREVEALDNDVCERAQSRGREGSEQLDQPEAPGYSQVSTDLGWKAADSTLWIAERFNNLFLPELAVLDSSLVVSNPLN
jgi:hypothetical protein